MKEEIRRERTIELSLEGYRLDDLRRWKTAEVELNQPLRGIKYKGTEYETDGRWDNIGYEVDEEGVIVLEKHQIESLTRTNITYSHCRPDRYY